MAVLTPHFDLPFRLSGSSFAVIEQDSPGDVANCVETIIRTPYGFREDSPQFGLDDHTFENMPLILESIEAQVEGQEPRASLTLGQELTDIVTATVTVRVSS